MASDRTSPHTETQVDAQPLGRGELQAGLGNLAGVTSRLGGRTSVKISGQENSMDMVRRWPGDGLKASGRPHRIEVLPSTQRIRISLGDLELALTLRARGLYEYGLPVRWYVPRQDVRMEALEPSETVTHCPFKGTPVHWSARVGERLVPDVAWSYETNVRPQAEEVSGYVAFYDEKVDVEIDGVTQQRPETPWS